jgi:hypothetical protein
MTLDCTLFQGFILKDAEQPLQEFLQTHEGQGMQPDKNEEYHPESLYYKDVKYLYRKELGRGGFGIVYLYEDNKEEGEKSKIAVKAAREGNLESSKSI